MSIVKMQKVSVIGLDKIKGRLIARMMDLEAVELTDQTEKLSEEFWADNTVQDGAQDQVTYFDIQRIRPLVEHNAKGQFRMRRCHFIHLPDILRSYRKECPEFIQDLDP